MENQTDIQFLIECFNRLEEIFNDIENAGEAVPSDLRQEFQSIKDEITQ